jgi:hypothetical protein
MLLSDARRVRKEIVPDFSCEDSGYEQLVRKVFFTLAVSLGLFSVWLCRYSMDPDGISYLDIGDAFAGGNWKLALNTYWSPVYPWLLGVPVHFLGRTPRSELITAHGVNFGIYLFAFACFEFFLRSSLATLPPEDATEADLCPLPRWGLLAIGYSLFLWSSLTLITVWELSPDLLVSGMVFLIAGYLLRLRERVAPWTLITLGSLLGIAYWCKAVLFPLGVVFGVIALGAAKRGERHFYNVLLIAIPFALICLPLVIPLSKKDGKWTFGDSGWLNYSSLVSPGGRVRNWQGSPPQSGVPTHPTRQILDDPPVFEFALPFAVTYPPTFEPGYWNAGRTWTFDFRAQLIAVLQHSLMCLELLLHSQSGLFVGVFALLICGAGYRTVFAYWPLFAVSFATFAIYMLVHLEVRFIGAAVAVAWFAVLLGMRLSKKTVASGLAASLLIAVSVSIMISVFGGIARDWRSRRLNSALSHVAVTEGLYAMGFQPHAKLAVIGDGDWSYWAQLGHLQLVAEIMALDAPGFWKLRAEQRASVYSAMTKAGASAVVSEPPLPLAILDDGWQRIGDTNLYVRRLGRAWLNARAGR